MSGQDRRTILLVAYGCEPGLGSEPGVGWSWMQALARENRVVVLTRESNRSRIDAWQDWDPELRERVRFVYHDLSGAVRSWKRGRRGVHLYYYLWQRKARQVAEGILAQEPVDLVHHVTLGTYWLPSVAGLLGVPYVLGPVGGGESVPTGMWKYVSPRGRLFEYVRLLGRRVFELAPFVRKTVRRASVILASTPETEARLRRMGAGDVRLMLHVGLEDNEDVADPAVHQSRDRYRLLSVARLAEWKGIHLALQALARSGRDDVVYEILGEGPERERLGRLAAELGIADRVVFRDRLPERSDVLRLVASSDVFVHLALHESGGMAVAEAMAAGVPCVVLDTGGPGRLVDESCGVAVAPAGDAVGAVAEALERLLDDPELRTELGAVARERIAHERSWDRKAGTLHVLYREAVGARDTDAPAERSGV